MEITGPVDLCREEARHDSELDTSINQVNVCTNDLVSKTLSTHSDSRAFFVAFVPNINSCQVVKIDMLNSVMDTNKVEDLTKIQS
ncbi:unnamed protein product [Arabis nemorensis]|uniref:Uncharacterized protein n=1 Tax=Arabis nemorensis TaxID=586526 RepID=A0A565AZ68_9BRAS|nr:unnamed protein product [Arabis nemorensis]